MTSGERKRVENRFTQMDCFVLAGGKSNAAEDFQREGDYTRIEKGYRRYAAVFEKVTLVLKEEQATERYLNYPHICDDEPTHGAVAGIRAALSKSDSEAVFIGSTDITEFPLELAVDLVRRYDGEMFLGYNDHQKGPDTVQPLFGIYSKKLAARLLKAGQSTEELAELIRDEGRLMPLPGDTPADQTGLR